MGRKTRSLHGKIVVITGGAQGIGARTADALVRQGARVAIGDLDQVRADKTAGELGDAAVALPLDVTDPAGFGAFLDEVEQRLGPVDVLINNAGIMPLAEVDEETDSATRRILEINLHAVIHGTREAVRRMRTRGTGHIVNVASVAGKAGFSGAATYCASKHGVVGFTESVHLELRGSGIDVTCVHPAVVRTELASGLGDTRMIKQVAPDDVAAAIVGALQRPRFDVFVPQYLDLVSRVTRLLPRGFGEWFTRFLGGDKLLSSATHSPARTEYEARAAGSAPSVDQEQGPKLG